MIVYIWSSSLTWYLIFILRTKAKLVIIIAHTHTISVVRLIWRHIPPRPHGPQRDVDGELRRRYTISPPRRPPMKQKTWPCKSDGLHFAALPFLKKPNDFSTAFTKPAKTHFSFFNSAPRIPPSSSSSSSPISSSDFAAFPYDVLSRIAASFSMHNLMAASLVCRAWRDALRPLREAMVFLKWGKRFKHGRGGVKANLGKALDSFLKAAARGSTLAMVDAGLIYWEMGKREEGIVWYRRAAELGDPAGQCNLAITCLQGIILFTVWSRIGNFVICSTLFLLNAQNSKIFSKYEKVDAFVSPLSAQRFMWVDDFKHSSIASHVGDLVSRLSQFLRLQNFLLTWTLIDVHVFSESKM